MTQPRNSPMEAQRHELLEGVSAQISAVLKELNIDEDKAALAGSEVITQLAKNWGGQHVYFPKDAVFQGCTRSIAIYEACNGRNFPEVARKFDISLRSVYRIYNRIHAQMVARNQPDMFT